MIKNLLALLVATQIVVVGSEETDLLRFENGDQLHGSFQGIAKGPTVTWNRDDVGEAVKFKTSDLRQIILNGRRPSKPLRDLAHIGTVNGDRIPGVVTELDEEHVTVDTGFGGTIKVPRERVGLIAPSPLGGRILYYGPFDQSEWMMVDKDNPGGLPPIDKEAEDGKEDDKDQMRWNFTGSAWHWNNNKVGTGLIRKGAMPDKSIFQCQVSWKSRLSLAIGFYSDFEVPKEEEAEEKKGPVVAVNQRLTTNSLPGIFGDSYVLHLYSNYVVLYKTYFDAEGKPRADRMRANHSSVRLGDSGKAKIELRCNREEGQIILFVNDEFAVQWSEPVLGQDAEGKGEFRGKGNGFGFLVQSENSPVRISEVLVAEWNGMPDAAKSLQVEESDIVLLTNGTDRFSGKVKQIKEGKIKLEGRYGDFMFPIEEVAEIRFAKDSLVESEEIGSDSIKVHFYPIGRVTGKPVSGDSEKLQILNDAVGEIDVNLNSAVMLEFRSSETYLDDWDLDY